MHFRRKDANQDYKISRRFGHTLLFSANYPHRWHSIEWARAPNWGSGGRQGRTPAGASCGPARWEMGWDHMLAMPKRQTQCRTVGLNEEGLSCIYPNLPCRKQERDPMGCCRSRPWGWEAVLALCIVVSHRKSLDLSGNKPLHRSSWQSPEPLEHLLASPSGRTASISPSCRLKPPCLHSYNSLHGNQDPKWAGTSYFCSFWDRVEKSGLFKVFGEGCHTMTWPCSSSVGPSTRSGTVPLLSILLWLNAGKRSLNKTQGCFFEQFSCICREGGQLPAWLREDVGWQRQDDCWRRSQGADSWVLSPCQHRRLSLTSAAERVLGVSPSSLSAQESLLIPYTMPGRFYCGTGNDMERLGMGMQLIGTLDFLHDFKL